LLLEGDDTTAADSAASSAPPSVGGMTGDAVTVGGPEATDVEIGALQDAFDAFSSETGITITYVGSTDWDQQLGEGLEHGTEPDIAIFDRPARLVELAGAGLLQPLPQATEDAVAEAWDEDWLGAGRVGGALYGVPTRSELKSLVWYRPARFDELGYRVPQTWDQLKGLTLAAVDDGVTPWCIGIESGTATGWPFTDWVEDLLLRFHGPEVYDQWVSGELPFDDPRVVQIFDEVRDFWSIDGAVYAPGGSIATTPYDLGSQSLIDGECLMLFQSSLFTALIPEGTPLADGSSEAVDVFYLPPVADLRPVVGGGTLAAALHDRPEVWQVMEYLGSAEFADNRQAAQLERRGDPASVSGFLSAVEGANRSLYTPLEQSMLDVLARADTIRFDGSELMPPAVGSGAFWVEGTAFVNGDQDAVTAAAAIAAAWPP
jgi:alpha-glucoside transport system substrate-binding protein